MAAKLAQLACVMALVYGAAVLGQAPTISQQIAGILLIAFGGFGYLAGEALLTLKRIQAAANAQRDALEAIAARASRAAEQAGQEAARRAR